MKWILLLAFVFSCQKQDVAATQSSVAVGSEVISEEDCDDKAKKTQEIEITEETIKLGGQPDAGCTLE